MPTVERGKEATCDDRDIISTELTTWGTEVLGGGAGRLGLGGRRRSGSGSERGSDEDEDGSEVHDGLALASGEGGASGVEWADC